jgi:heterodisulfide reductase subunit A
MDYDVLIIGAGVSGMESALTLGDMGFKVLLVEKKASIGGNMILLSKVFPTLDCASCISTPKMAATANHPNIKILINTEIESVYSNNGNGFMVNLVRKSTFIDLAKCTGCAQCETTCTVAIADEFNANLIARRAAHIAFPQAVPKKATIDRRGSSPCSYTCPAGVKPHGYVSLVRAGKYDEAFKQHLDDAPLPGCLSRACYAPCEEECTRGYHDGMDGNVSIRSIKRFMVDRYYKNHSEPSYGPPEKLNGKKVAIVGSGPTGLTAAYFLTKSGYSVTIFELKSEPGGIMRWGIPPYRLPKNVLARDIKNITALGVEIRTNFKINSLDSLRQFDTIFVASGSTGGRKLAVHGEDKTGIIDCIDFLYGINSGFPLNIKGKKTVVIGGGNVAIDCARSALRLGAADVHLFCLESREEMPAHKWEIQEAIDEGVSINCHWGVRQIRNDGINVTGVDFIGCSSIFDKDNRFNPKYDETMCTSVETGIIIVAIGLKPNTTIFSEEIALNRNGKILVNTETLQTSLPHVFAGGDAVTGPANIVKSIGQGKRAAFFIDRYLQGRDMNERFDERMPMVDRDEIISHAGDNVSLRKPVISNKITISERLKTFEEFEATMTEEQARYSANLCLDCGGCSQCRQCVSTCPAGAISLDMQPEKQNLSVGSVAIATGFQVFDARNKPSLGFGRFPNVINGMQMDRILAPTRPYNAVVRPSDGKAPSNIAFVLCTGSRDETAGNRLCSRVCCMYSLKQAQLLMGALPLADITIYYIDIRTFGKGYEEFYQQAKGMAVNFVKGKVARIEEIDNQDLLVYYEDIEGKDGSKKSMHDLVVLSVGMLPVSGAAKMFKNSSLLIDESSYIKEIDEDLEPGRTSIDGVFAIGSATAVRDIPDTILHSGAVASQIAAYLQKAKGRSKP